MLRPTAPLNVQRSVGTNTLSPEAQRKTPSSHTLAKFQWMYLPFNKQVVIFQLSRFFIYLFIYLSLHIPYHNLLKKVRPGLDATLWRWCERLIIQKYSNSHSSRKMEAWDLPLQDVPPYCDKALTDLWHWHIVMTKAGVGLVVTMFGVGTNIK